LIITLSVTYVPGLVCYHCTRSVPYKCLPLGEGGRPIYRDDGWGWIVFIPHPFHFVRRRYGSTSSPRTAL